MSGLSEVVGQPAAQLAFINVTCDAIVSVPQVTHEAAVFVTCVTRDTVVHGTC